MRIKTLFTTLAMLISLSAWAQKPSYAPFRHQGKIGIMDTKGNEFRSPGSFGENYNYLVAGDFKHYIIQDDLTIVEDSIFHASGGEIEAAPGKFDADAFRLLIGDDTYYHFVGASISVLFSPEQGVKPLSKRYVLIEPNQQAWANERKQGREFLWAMTTDGWYEVLDAQHNFSIVEHLPNFSSYDLIFQSAETAPMKLVGFALGQQESIEREIGQMYGIPESDEKVDIYDVDFKKIGTSAYRSKDISAIFKNEVRLRGGMRPPPQMKNRVIVPDGGTIRLNDEFSLIPDASHGDRLNLVNTKKNNALVLGSADFDYRYFSTSSNLQALLEIRHRESGSFFFFDFDGTFFPKGVPMIPQHRMNWK